MNFVRRGVCLSLALMHCAVSAQTGSARQIRLIVPFAAGTTTDLVGRVLAEAYAAELGNTVIVENKPGAGGAIGTDQVARTGADGTSILLGTVGTHAINPSLYKRLPYDAMRDFATLGLVGSTPTLLVVPADGPLKSFAELARAEGSSVNFASAGNGTSGHLAGVLLNQRLGKAFVHVPYRDGGQALQEVIAGNVQFMFYHPTAAVPQMRAGKLRALAVSSAQRTPAAPDVPTLNELGVKDFDLVAWFMLYASAQVESAQLERLRAATVRVLARTDVREKLEKQGVEPGRLSPSESAAFGSAEMGKWGEIVRRSGAQVD